MGLFFPLDGEGTNQDTWTVLLLLKQRNGESARQKLNFEQNSRKELAEIQKHMSVQALPASDVEKEEKLLQ